MISYLITRWIHCEHDSEQRVGWLVCLFVGSGGLSRLIHPVIQYQQLRQVCYICKSRVDFPSTFAGA